MFHDTFGFPKDLTEIIAAEQNLKIDHIGYQNCMREQQERARAAAQFDDDFGNEKHWTLLSENTETTFKGYDSLSLKTETLRYREVGDTIFVVLRDTPFYAESGGQRGDLGEIRGTNLTLTVNDTTKILDFHVHHCALKEGLLNDENMRKVEAYEARRAVRRYHMQRDRTGVYGGKR